MSELITVDFRPDGRDIEPALRVKRRDYAGCQHHQTLVSEELRRVTCADCGELLDPVEVILLWAREWSRYADAVKYLRMEEEHKRRELAHLLRRMRNVRATIRRDLKSEQERVRDRVNTSVGYREQARG